MKVQRGGYTIIRFLANNPGIWFAHCHKDLHSEHGLAFMLKVGDVKQFPQTPNKWPKCGDYFYENLNKISISFNESESKVLNEATGIKRSLEILLFILFLKFIL